MGRMIRLKDEGRSPAKGGQPSGRVAERTFAGRRESGSGAGAGGSSENPGSEPDGAYYEPAARMQVSSFVKKYRRRIQGFLWNRAERQGVGDYLKVMEAEREMTKRSVQKRPKEVRVLWVHEDATEQ